MPRSRIWMVSIPRSQSLATSLGDMHSSRRNLATRLSWSDRRPSNIGVRLGIQFSEHYIIFAQVRVVFKNTINRLSLGGHFSNMAHWKPGISEYSLSIESVRLFVDFRKSASI